MLSVLEAVSRPDYVHSPHRRGPTVRRCARRKLRPCSSDGMLILVDHAPESVVPADVQVGDAIWIGDRCGDRT
jgi:hypothetical protein